MSSFSYKDFFAIWCLEEDHDLMDKIRSGAITFFDEKQSRILYSMFISSEGKHIMEMGDDKFFNDEKYTISFDDKTSAIPVFKRFKERVRPRKPLVLFLNSASAMILEFDLLCEHWDTLFYPFEDAMLAIDVDSRTVLLSSEERFFIANINN